MFKKYKKLLIVVLSLVIVAALLFIGFQAFIHTVYFEYDDIRGIGSWSDDEGYAEYERLMSEGYIIARPQFHNKTPWGKEVTHEIYYTINNPIFKYTTEIVEKYKNYAKLDYTVTVKENEILTVAFTGTGYFYDEREPEPINKTFVFDINGVSPNKLPMLISE